MTTTCRRGSARTCQRGEHVYLIFLEILGTVESSLCQLAALVRYSGPVRLTHHEANSALSIRVLLLFEVGPSNLDRDDGRGLFMSSGNHLHIKRFCWCLPERSLVASLSRRSSPLPFSSLAQTCAWRSRQAAAGSRRGRPRPRASSSRCLRVRPTCLHKREIRAQLHRPLGCVCVVWAQRCRSPKLGSTRRTSELWGLNTGAAKHSTLCSCVEKTHGQQRAWLQLKC